ncbi:tubulin-folding cofactor B [Rissa tridactyla]|uniref:tubulin-folding cofactor B n=1 Tax=Rissa tridactyla TaxID=75485 RepID=UPI0023BB14D7|nr:tubulin-folding cofactor B [Rissa tridactyla]
MKAAAETGPGLGLGAGSVSLSVSSSLNSFRALKRYSTGLTIAEFKCKLELVVGSPASCMDLELYSTQEELLGRLDCDEALLGSYPVTDGCRIHVIDRSGARIGEYEDVSQVEKYQIADSDYDKRPGDANVLTGHLPSGLWPLSRAFFSPRSVGGRRYFECQPKYGAFVKPQSVTPGDFPEEDYGLDDEL